jgi:hypothetical protein
MDPVLQNQLNEWLKAGSISESQFHLTTSVILALKERRISCTIEAPCCGGRTVLLTVVKSSLSCEIDDCDVSVLEIIKPNERVDKYVYSGHDFRSVVNHIALCFNADQ